MDEETCILCGQRAPTGLSVMGCLICFPCERRLLRGLMPAARRRALGRIYESVRLEG